VNPCKKVHEMPPVVNGWQQTTWCPDCEYYHCGTCGNLTRTDRNAPCPFDGKALPLREVAVDSNNYRPQKPLEAGLCTEPESRSRLAELEQAIKHQIMQRTGGRIQLLDVQVKDGEVVVQGSAPCYYVKQLALQGVLEVIDSAQEIKVQIDVQVPERSATLWTDAQ
jgi:hypothetical protein